MKNKIFYIKMKQLLVILLIALATCASIEESSDNNKNNDYSIKPRSPLAPAYPARGIKFIFDDERETNATKPVIPKMDRIKNINEAKKFPIKGINGLFNGKVGEIFRKLEDIVKKGIAWLKKNNLWKPIIERLKNLGQKYGIELCEKYLSPEVCEPAIDFALKHLIPNGQN